MGNKYCTTLICQPFLCVLCAFFSGLPFAPGPLGFMMLVILPLPLLHMHACDSQWHTVQSCWMAPVWLAIKQASLVDPHRQLPS